MRKVLILSLLFTVSLNFVSCKSDKKQENKEEVVEKSSAFSLKEAKHTIGFTAYKTTEKIPVAGEFKEVKITSGGEGNSIKEAINNAEFSIPVSSLFTKDTSRDFTVKKFFFMVMKDPQLLSGKLVIENDSIGYTNIKMNGVTNKVNFKYTIINNEFKMNAVMDIMNWNGEAALTSLNGACLDLHKAADGVSKTWSEVNIKIRTIF